MCTGGYGICTTQQVKIVTRMRCQVGFATSEGNEEELLQGYDIVVPGDGPMHHVSTILEDLV
jgi:hypothetical protein